MSVSSVALNSLCTGHFGHAGIIFADRHYACRVHSIVMSERAENLCADHSSLKTGRSIDLRLEGTQAPRCSYCLNAFDWRQNLLTGAEPWY